MTTTGTDGRQRPHVPGAHRLLVADNDNRRRAHAAAWVGQELARGAKVYYKGWRDDAGTEPWIVGPDGAPGGQNAVASGQLEFLDFMTVIERCGGTTEGLLRLQVEECERAFDDGWPSVSMSQESPHRPMADDSEVVEFAKQEGGYDDLAVRWSLRTLCQLTVEEENAAAVWETAAVHHRDLVDVHWSSTFYHGQLQLRGALDAHIAIRFSAAIYGALRDARGSGPDPDLHIDMAAVEFMDFACAQVLLLNARSASRDQRVILHRTSSFLRHLLVAAGRPRTVLFDDETGAR